MHLLAIALAACLACGSAAPGTIGAGLGKRTDGRLFVRSLPPDEGAARAGLQVDDEIVAIDGKSVSGMTPDDVKRAVRGDSGTTMVLSIVREGAHQDVKVTRTPLLPPEKKR